MRAGDKSPQHNRPDGRTPRGGEADATHRKVEIVHESLLTAWPRLVRWQTQDIEGAQLRDELRQAAQMWDQHGRSEDLLWTGTAFREFQLWRERYPGGLSAVEEEFTRAMTTYAERRRRRRRLAAAAAFGLLVVVLAIVGGLWRLSEAETRRAEASKLLALSKLRQGDDPTEALAYAVASLELADSEAARVFALQLLLEGPQAIETEGDDMGFWFPSFSPDGRRLAVAGNADKVRVFDAAGGAPIELAGHETAGTNSVLAGWISNDLLATGLQGGPRVRFWKLPEGVLRRTVELGGGAYWGIGETHLLAEVIEADPRTHEEVKYHLRSWRLPSGQVEELGTIDLRGLDESFTWFNADGTGWFYGKGREIFYRPLPVKEGTPDRRVGSHENRALLNPAARKPNRVWTRDAVTSELRLWNLSSAGGEPLRVIDRPPGLEEGAGVSYQDPPGRWISNIRKNARLWDLEAWPEARPLTLVRSGSWFAAESTFDSPGNWFVVSTHARTRLTFWPLRRAHSRVVEGYSNLYVRPLTVSPDGHWIGTIWPDSTVRLWPLPGEGTREVRSVPLPQGIGPSLWGAPAFDPHGRFLFLPAYWDVGFIVPLDGSPPKRLEGFSGSNDLLLSDVAVSPSGRRVAVACRWTVAGRGDRTLRVWDLETDELRRYDLPASSSVDPDFQYGVWDLAFADESTVYTSGDGGVRRWHLDTGANELVLPTVPGSDRTWAAFSPDAKAALVLEPKVDDEMLGPPRLLDLTSGESRELAAFEESVLRSPSFWPRNAMALSRTIAAMGDTDGRIRVASLNGGEPHLLLGHEGPVDKLAITPDERWLVSSGEDDTLRLWPMPDLDKPPLHTLPLDELLAKLKTLTNIRAVRDPESPDGWKVTLDPFPGWAEVPTW